MMKKLLALSSAIDFFNTTITRLTAWLSLALVLLQVTIVALRYIFGTGSVPMQEITIYLYSMIFMLAAGGAFLTDDHVRVDIFYSRAREGYRLWVNLLGSLLFLLPFCILIIITSWKYVSLSWRVQEGSAEAGGLQAIYLLKTVIPIMAGLLLLQAISEIIKIGNKLTTGHKN